jgi:hypothetical protein
MVQQGEEISFQLYNSTGEKVFETHQPFDPSGMSLHEPGSSFAAGVYMLKLTHLAGSYYFKIVKW